MRTCVSVLLVAAAVVFTLGSTGAALADHEGVVTEDCRNVLANPTKINSQSPDCEPTDIVEIAPSLVADGYEPQYMRADAAVAFGNLMSAAYGQGHALYAWSGWRNYWVQNVIFWNYVEEFGLEEANRFSARPGHSEHQLGTTMDVSVLGIGLEPEFGLTAAGQWLAANAVNYGFVISYPVDGEPITGYVWEPWHIRWLGPHTAQAVVDSGISLTEWMAAAIDIYEGWNPLTWNDVPAIGVSSVIASTDASIHGTGWVSVAVYRDAWEQSFSDAPLPSFNSLSLLDSGDTAWIYSNGEGLFESLTR
jgi:D-alanyl-D-alanine carboxypeptidase